MAPSIIVDGPIRADNYLSHAVRQTGASLNAFLPLCFPFFGGAVEGGFQSFTHLPPAESERRRERAVRLLHKSEFSEVPFDSESDSFKCLAHFLPVPCTNPNNDTRQQPKATVVLRDWGREKALRDFLLALSGV
jgi:hypothetical protein